MAWPQSGTLLGSLFSTEAMAAVFSDRARLQAMLDVEAALARAEAACGVIPPAAAEAIAAAAKAELFDLEALGRAAVDGGNLAIPLVKALTERVASHNPEMARWVHWGTTSQDIIDTGLVLQIRKALRLIENDLDRLCDALAAIAERHALTPLAGRTLMQQAVPTTLGAKAAGWLTGIAHAKAPLWRCNSAARLERSPLCTTRAAALRTRSRGSSTSLCRRFPGTVSASASPISVAPWRC
jgi:3-carboxy-cis,cis-muconate cycloisomerase